MAVGTTAILVFSALLSACSDKEPVITIEERLEAIEGRSLSEAEVAELRSVATSLCQLDDLVLESLWTKLTLEQFDFQDFVFQIECPDRSTFYALSTGRVVTDEAKEATAGVILPTTTRPAPTTTESTERTSSSSTTRSSSTTSSAPRPATNG